MSLQPPPQIKDSKSFATWASQIGRWFFDVFRNWGSVSSYIGDSAVTLPKASAGKVFAVRNTGAGDIIVTPLGSALIESATTLTVATGVGVTLVSDGVNWFICGTK